MLLCVPRGVLESVVDVSSDVISEAGDDLFFDFFFLGSAFRIVDGFWLGS